MRPKGAMSDQQDCRELEAGWTDHRGLRIYDVVVVTTVVVVMREPPVPVVPPVNVKNGV